MPAILRAASSFFASSTSPTVTIPATTQGGDTMYIVTAGGWFPSATPPTGWTLANGPLGLYWQWAIYTKVASGTYGTTSPEAGATVTLTYTGGAFDVQSSIIVVDAGGAVISPTISSSYTTTSSIGVATVNPTVRRSELVAYVGSGRPNSALTLTLSRGTTLNTRSADTNSGSVIGSEIATANTTLTQNFTPNVSGTGNRGQASFALVFNQPFSNTFAAAGEIRLSKTISGLDTTTWSTEAGEPGGLDKTGWATFTPTTTARYALTTVGSNFDTVANIYTGSSLNALTLVSSDDDSGGSGTSVVAANLTSGTTYYIQVGAKSGGAGGLLTARLDQYAAAQMTSTHSEYISDAAGQSGGISEKRLTSTHTEIITDGAGVGGGKPTIRLLSTHVEVLTPMRKAFEGWSQPL